MGSCCCCDCPSSPSPLTTFDHSDTNVLSEEEKKLKEQEELAYRKVERAFDKVETSRRTCLADDANYQDIAKLFLHLDEFLKSIQELIQFRATNHMLGQPSTIDDYLRAHDRVFETHKTMLLRSVCDNKAGVLKRIYNERGIYSTNCYTNVNIQMIQKLFVRLMDTQTYWSVMETAIDNPDDSPIFLAMEFIQYTIPDCFFVTTLSAMFLQDRFWKFSWKWKYGGLNFRNTPFAVPLLLVQKWFDTVKKLKRQHVMLDTACRIIEKTCIEGKKGNHFVFEDTKTGPSCVPFFQHIVNTIEFVESVLKIDRSAHHNLPNMEGNGHSGEDDVLCAYWLTLNNHLDFLLNVLKKQYKKCIKKNICTHQQQDTLHMMRIFADTLASTRREKDRKLSEAVRAELDVWLALDDHCIGNNNSGSGSSNSTTPTNNATLHGSNGTRVYCCELEKEKIYSTTEEKEKAAAAKYASTSVVAADRQRSYALAEQEAAREIIRARLNRQTALAEYKKTKNNLPKCFKKENALENNNLPCSSLSFLVI